MWIWIGASITVISSIIAYALLSINAKRVISPYKFSDYQLVTVQQDREEKQQQQQYSIMDQASLDLSIVFPAYLEQDRIIHTLDVTSQYLKKRRKEQKQEENQQARAEKTQTEEFSYEMIVVDDGSRDQTSQTVLNYMTSHPSEPILLLRLPKNMGKGFAVKQGILRCRGRQILMADADSATEISDLQKLQVALDRVVENRGSGQHGFAVGSRAHLAQGVVRERKWYRNVLMHGWHFLVQHIAGVTHINDTQCGFKLFTRETAKLLFLNLKIDRWCFDIDMFQIAMKLKIPHVEVPVNWREIEGSKMNLKGMVTMGIDLLLIRLYYMLGFWTVDANVTLPTQ